MTTLEGLHERLKAHATSFDELLKLIPAKYYITERTDDETNDKYQKNKRKKAPKQAVKEATKKAKKAKLDPELQKSINQLQFEKEKATREAEENDLSRTEQVHDQNDRNNKFNEMNKHNAEKKDFMEVDEDSNKQTESLKPIQPSSITELRARVQDRIAELRRKRNAPGISPNAAEATRESILKTRLKKKQVREEKRKQLREKKLKLHKEEIISDIKYTKNDSLVNPADAIKLNANVQFGKIEFDGQGKKKKGSASAKQKLQQVEGKQLKLDKLKVENKEKAQLLAEKEQWKKALAQASGEKIKDDVKLLKKTIKREEAAKKKSAKEWSERKDNLMKMMAQKQKKRQENIHARNAKESKKANMKKPKQRPGFEGGKPKRKN